MQLVTLIEKINKNDLDRLEHKLDSIWSMLGVDIAFTKHFLDRVNHERNMKPITIKEIEKVFMDTFKKYGKQISQMTDDEIEAVLFDVQTQLNIPFVLKWDSKQRMMVLVSKTIMRKKNFSTPNKKLHV